MKDPKRPLDATEISWLLLERIVAGTHPAPSREYTNEEWSDILWHTPMGQDPAAYAPFHLLAQQRVGGTKQR